MNNFSYSNLTDIIKPSSSQRPKPTSATPITDFLDSAKKENGKKRRPRSKPKDEGDGSAPRSSSFNDFFRLAKASSTRAGSKNHAFATTPPSMKQTENRSLHDDLPATAPVTDFANSGRKSKANGAQDSPKKNSSTNNLQNLLPLKYKRSPTRDSAQESPKKSSSARNLLLQLKSKKSPKSDSKKVNDSSKISSQDLGGLLKFVTTMKASDTGRQLLSQYVDFQTGTKTEKPPEPAMDDFLDDSSLWIVPCSEVLVAEYPQVSGLFDDISDAIGGMQDQNNREPFR